MSLHDVLAVTPLSDGSFEARPAGDGFLFGGLTLGVALRAAAATVGTGMIPKSFHGYFLRPGLWGPPLVAHVQHTTDGRSLASRYVSIAQADRVLAVVTTTFHRPGVGVDWQAIRPPDTVPPEELMAAPASMAGQQLIEVRPLQPAPTASLAHSIHPYWARVSDPLGEDPAVHGSALAFLSDYMVILSMLKAGQELAQPTGIRTVDHGLWFHRPVNAEDWLLFSCDPISMTDGRGFATGSIHSRDGDLVASFAQQVIIPS